MGYLESLEVENFKSYKGIVKFGPFKQYSAIIGPNGSGKSNVMDAISFVLGEKTNNLRVKQLSELIHGANVNNPISNTARVTIIYCETEGENEDEKDGMSEEDKENWKDQNGNVLPLTEQKIISKTEFTRIIRGTGSEHRINDKKVTVAEYTKSLENIDIFIKYKNFLVFQGHVEQIALKNPNELSELFEQISGSVDYKSDYNKAILEKRRCDQQTALEFNKKKGIASERKEAKLRKDEAEKYQKIKEDHKSQEMIQYLLKLYICEKTILINDNSFSELSTDNSDLQVTVKELNEKLKQAKTLINKKSRENLKIENKIMKESAELGATKPKFAKAKESTKHAKQKYEQNKKTLETHKKNLENISVESGILEKKVSDCEVSKSDYIKAYEDYKKNDSGAINLTIIQEEEYQDLKLQVTKRSGEIQGEVNSAKRMVQNMNDMLAMKTRHINDLEHQISHDRKQFASHADTIEATKNHIEKTKKDIAKQEIEREQVAKKKAQLNKKSKELQNKLDDLTKKQGDARVEQSEMRRRRKGQETVNNLKNLYPGVFGRLVDLIEPVDRKYNLALTRIMGGHMNSIVVDNTNTASHCLSYLKEQRIGIETFLPCDSLKFRPIDESLREKIRYANHPDNSARLIFDVIKFQPEIRNAVSFVVGNSLVCEDDDSAENWSYNKVSNERRSSTYSQNRQSQNSMASGGNSKLETVSLTGTHFQKNGSIAGGLHQTF